MIKTIIFNEKSYEKLILKINLSSRAAIYNKQEILNVDINPEKKLFGTIWHGSVIIKTDSMSEFNDAVFTNYRNKGLIDLKIHEIGSKHR